MWLTVEYKMRVSFYLGLVGWMYLYPDIDVYIRTRADNLSPVSTLLTMLLSSGSQKRVQTEMMFRSGCVYYNKDLQIFSVNYQQRDKLDLY